MQGFKDFYHNKQGRAILFFGFYFVFFLVLAIGLKNRNVIQDNSSNKTEIIIQSNDSDYDLSKIISKYKIDIKGNVNKEKLEYFLNIYNINQLIKKSKFIKRENNLLNFELNNQILNELLNTDSTGISKINLYVNEKNNVIKIEINLLEYQKEECMVIIEYQEGEENE